MYPDAVWSFYEYAKFRLLTYISNPANNPGNITAISTITVKGILNAQDWPSKPITTNAFYLLVLDSVPIGKQGYSQYSPIYFHPVQWVWIIKGTDLVAGVRQANRGDRYAINEVMKGAVIYASVPGYSPKFTWSLVNGVFTGSPTSTPNEAITWNPPEFRDRLDKESGLSYGAARLRICDMTDPVLS